MEEESQVDRPLHVDDLKQDTGLETSEVQTAMQDRKLWKTRVVRGHHST